MAIWVCCWEIIVQWKTNEVTKRNRIIPRVYKRSRGKMIMNEIDQLGQKKLEVIYIFV